MKKLLILILVLLTGIAQAQVTPTELMGLGMAPALSSKVASIGNGSRVRASEGTAALPSHSFSTDTDTGMYSSAANEIGFAVNGVAELACNATSLNPLAASGLNLGTAALPFSAAHISGDINLQGNTSKIVSNTSDAADTKANYFSGGGSNADTRGAQVVVTGNENAAPGTVYVHSGNVATAYNDYDARHASGYHSFKVAGSEKIRVNATGEIIGSGTATIGWTVVSAANTACSTTCVTPCVFGQETTSKAILACSDATADSCLCAGAS